jgi:hypothetical protein
MPWSAGATGNGAGGEEQKPKRRVKVTVPKWCGKWVVSMDEFEDGVVGAKSKNLAGDPLRGGCAVNMQARKRCDAAESLCAGTVAIVGCASSSTGTAGWPPPPI